MRYLYECKNKKCPNFDKPQIINKPMSECSKDEFCDSCNKKMNRVFSLSGHQTFGDGYKS